MGRDRESIHEDLRGSRGILNVSYAILKVSKRWILGGWTSAGAILKEDPQEKKKIYIYIYSGICQIQNVLEGVERYPKGSKRLKGM